MHAETVTGRVRHRIDESVHELARARRQLGILAAARIDRERLTAGHTGHVVGPESGGVDADVRVNALARRDDGHPACRVQLDGFERSALQHCAAVTHDLGAEGRDEAIGIDPASVRRPERGSRRDVRLAPGDERPIDGLEPARRCARAFAARRFERVLLACLRHDELAAPDVRHAMRRGRRRTAVRGLRRTGAP